MCLLSPSSPSGYTCKCKPGYRTGPNGQCIEEETAFLMIMRGSQIVDVSLTPNDKTTGFLTPIVGVENGIQIDYDRRSNIIFWLEGKSDGDRENVSMNKVAYILCL